MAQRQRAEQRRAHRVAIEIPLQFTCPDQGEKVPGVSRDLSLGGMFVETAFPAALGAPVVLSFTLPGHPGPLRLSGTVRSARGE